MQEGKEAIDEVKMDKKVEVNLVQKPETELRTASVSTSDNAKASIIPRDPVTLSNCGEIQKVRVANFVPKLQRTHCRFGTLLSFLYRKEVDVCNQFYLKLFLIQSDQIFSSLPNATSFR